MCSTPPCVRSMAVVLLPSSMLTVNVRSQTHPVGPVDPADLLQDLIRFDTSNPPGNERPCLEFVASALAEAAIESRFIAKEPDRPNLIARVRGAGEASPLLLYGHVDVVPARPEGWTRQPFSGDAVDGVIWGRGALDMKGGVAMLIAALLRVAGRASPPAADLILVLTSDEERGSRLGAKFLVDEHPELFSGVRYAFSEIGGFTEWVGDRRLYPVQVAEKQRCLVRATIRGAGGHPSTVVRGTSCAPASRAPGLASRTGDEPPDPPAREGRDAAGRVASQHRHADGHSWRRQLERDSDRGNRRPGRARPARPHAC